MKKGVLSICIAIIGIYFIYWFNIDLYKKSVIFTEQSNNTAISNSYIFKFAKTFTIATVCLGLLSLYFGVISFLKKNKVGGIGIILAVLLIICAFIPFWKHI
ncbi:hypothetical protein [Aquimarina sp. I32.4]|uniref:hypothetical protein n=1 Tax=Aquimarina sp. I32.4 TaxID=2053903 RepID=UPI000CDED1C5|nr:hypothetical protein [Aquimarina sp. I32.4]